jgi:DNA-binding Lrp family transcriptional regulator
MAWGESLRCGGWLQKKARPTKYGQGVKMVTSIILINPETTKINEVAEQVAEMEGVSEVYSVSGNYDLIAIVHVPSNDALSDLVTKKMLSIQAILKSETMLAFKAFSRHDLEAMFGVGM